MGTSLSISCNNRSWLKMYQGLLLNGSKMALKGEIIMNLGTKWSRLLVQSCSEITVGAYGSFSHPHLSVTSHLRHHRVTFPGNVKRKYN